MYERLLLMKELLSQKGFIFVHCDWHKNAYIKLLLDEVFGPENFRNEITARRIKQKSTRPIQDTDIVKLFWRYCLCLRQFSTSKFNTR